MRPTVCLTVRVQRDWGHAYGGAKPETYSGYLPLVGATFPRLRRSILLPGASKRVHLVLWVLPLSPTVRCLGMGESVPLPCTTTRKPLFVSSSTKIDRIPLSWFKGHLPSNRKRM